MRKLNLVFLLLFLQFSSFSQIINTSKLKDSIKDEKQSLNNEINNLKSNIKDSTNNVILNKKNQFEAVWDQGVPILLDDENIMSLVYQLDADALKDVSKMTDEQVRIYRELGVEFYNKGMYQEADFYLSKIKKYSTKKQIKLKEVFKDKDYYSNISQIRNEIKTELEKEYKSKLDVTIKENADSVIKDQELSEADIKNIKADVEFVKSLPQQIDKLSKNDLENLSKQLDEQIDKLIKERDLLVKNHSSQALIDSKDSNIKTLKKEKQVIDLNIDNETLKEEKIVIRRWLWGTISTIAVLVLSIFVILQRKTIKIQDKEIAKQLEDINKKNTYLEHAARIIRHDMHSGINTYIPRGISSLEKRLTPEQLIDLRIDGSVKMIREGLNHTQKVYKSVYEFTNLVKQNVVLDKVDVSLKELFDRCILTTSYSSQITVSELPNAKVNETLFWNAIDNLIKNGLKYNKSEEKRVKIYLEGGNLILEDNGVGLTQNKLNKILSSYSVEKESESGLGLNICVAILKEHGFELSCEKIYTGTKMKIKMC